jgi:hypothetical protein
MHKPSHRVFFFICCLLLFLSIFIFTAGCSGTATTSSTSSSSTVASTTADTGDYRINIVYHGESFTALSLAQLQTLPKISLNAFNKSEEGPTLLSALELAGVKDFTALTVIGMLRGRIASGELTLMRNEITNEVILDFSNHGTAKLAGPNIPEDNWIIDVSEMRIE